MDAANRANDLDPQSHLLNIERDRTFGKLVEGGELTEDSMKVFGKVAATFAFGMVVIAAPASAQTFKAGVDANGDGQLDVAEYVAAVSALDMVRFDVNGDGSVTAAEFGESNQRPANRTAQLVRKYDANKDDILQLSELMAMNEDFFSTRDKDGNGSVSVSEVNPELRQR